MLRDETGGLYLAPSQPADPATTEDQQMISIQIHGRAIDTTDDRYRADLARAREAINVR